VHDVFISFKSEDKIIAEKIYNGLMSRGIRCWISSKSITPGNSYPEEIVRAISECQIMVLIFSSAAQNSIEIQKELALASQDKKVLIPVRIEDIQPLGAFKYHLASSQYLDIFSGLEKRFDEYLDQIYSNLSHRLPKAERESVSSNSQLPPKADLPQSEASFDEGVSNKRETALRLCDENKNLGNGALAHLIAKEMGITYDNAYYYVSRVWKRPILDGASIGAQDALNKIENPEIRSRIDDCIERGVGEFKADNCRLVFSGPGGMSWNLNGQKYGVYLWQPKRFENDIALYQKHGLEKIEEKAGGKSLSAVIRSGVAFDNLMRLVKGMQTNEEKS
jgi:hypothetical protein